MLKKDVTIEDFEVKNNDEVDYVEWSNIKKVLGKRRYKKFAEWMFGQTSFPEGAYAHDLKRYLRTLKGIPTYFD